MGRFSWGSPTLTHDARSVPIRPAESPEGSDASSRAARALLDGIDGIVWEADADLRFTFISKQAEVLLGYPRGRFVEEPHFWQSVIHPTDREWVVQRIRREVQQGRDHEVEFRMLTSTGHTRWMLTKVFVETHDDRKESRVARGVMLDITDRKESECRHAAQLEVTHILAESTDIAEAAPRLLRAVGQPLGFEIAGFWALEAAGGHLACVATWQSPGVEAKGFVRSTRGAVFAEGEGLPGRVWRSGRSEWIETLSGDENFPRHAEAERAGLRSAVGFPIFGKAGVLGILDFYTRETRPLDETLLAFLDSLGRQMGIFLERRIAEEEVRRSNALRGAILSASLDGIISIDAEGIVHEWNPAAERIFGFERKEAVGRTLGSLIVPENLREAHARGLARAVSTREHRLAGQRVELPAIRKDGTEILVELAIMAIPGANPPRYTGFLRDITRHKHAEQNLQFQTALLEAQMEAMPVGLVVASPSGDVVSWNQRFCEMLDVEEARLESGAVDLPALVRERLQAPGSFDARLRALEAAPTEVARERIRFKNGQVHEWYSAPVTADDGAHLGRIWTFRDITKEQQTQDRMSVLLHEVDEQRRRLDAIVTSVPGVVWEAWGSPDEAMQRIDFVSDHVEQLLGYTTREWLATPNFWLKIVHPEDRERAARESTAIYESGGIGSIEFRWLRKDGGVLHVVANSVVVKDADGRPIGMRGVTLDVSDHKRALEVVRRSNERFHLLARATDDAVWDWDISSGTLWWNDNFYARFGYDTEEVEPGVESWATRVHPDDRERVTRSREEALASEATTWSDEYRFSRKDGAYVDVLDRGFIARGDDGRPHRMIGSMMDVTERKRAEAELAVSEERFRSLVRATSQIVWTADADGSMRPDTPSWSAFTGQRDGEWTGLGWLEAIHPDDRERTERVWREAIKRRTLYEIKYRLRRADGTYATTIARAVPVLNADGAVREFVGMNVDVTEQEHGEQALRESESRYRFLSDSVPQQVWTANADGLLDHVNARVLQYFGKTYDAMIGDGWQSVVHPDDLGDVLSRWTRSLRTGEAYEVEFRLKRHDGEYRWHVGRALPLRDESGRIVKWFGANSDVEAIKQAEAELKARALQLAAVASALERSNRELDQFAYITSHDLKAPLRGIANLATWIEEDLGEAVTPEVHAHIDLLRGRVNRMEALIDAILQYSRAGRVKARPEHVDVAHLLRETIDLIAPPFGMSVVAEGELPTLVADRARLQQVFMNLIGNAVKHHHEPTKGTIRIAAEDAGDFWRFTVQDDGPGIAERFHEKIFVIFQTLEARDKVEGTGIGLALVKKIVQSQGGTVTLESQEGKGATFRFTWPKRPPEEKGGEQE